MSEPLKGAKLAEAAHLRAMARDRYRHGVEIADLVRDLELTGIRIAGDNPEQTLRSALNADQARWVNRDRTWVPIQEKRPVGTEFSGRALADVIYPFVQERYATDRVFHYETAKEQLLATGVRIKGRATGPTMRKALVGSPEKFEPYPARGRGWWRWKAVE
jgi:hypothetical protein